MQPEGKVGEVDSLFLKGLVKRQKSKLQVSAKIDTSNNLGNAKYACLRSAQYLLFTCGEIVKVASMFAGSFH
jgi:hypothetical protein